MHAPAIHVDQASMLALQTLMALKQLCERTEVHAEDSLPTALLAHAYNHLQLLLLCCSWSDTPNTRHAHATHLAPLPASCLPGCGCGALLLGLAPPASHSIWAGHPPPHVPSLAPPGLLILGRSAQVTGCYRHMNNVVACGEAAQGGPISSCNPAMHFTPLNSRLLGLLRLATGLDTCLCARRSTEQDAIGLRLGRGHGQHDNIGVGPVSSRSWGNH